MYQETTRNQYQTPILQRARSAVYMTMFLCTDRGFSTDQRFFFILSSRKVRTMFLTSFTLVLLEPHHFV